MKTAIHAKQPFSSANGKRVTLILLAAALLLGCGGDGGFTPSPGEGNPGTPDAVPPEIVSTAPTDATINVAVDAILRITFSKSMDSTTINGTTFKVRAGTAEVAGTITCSAETVSFAPAINWSFATTYTVTVSGGPSGVKDMAGNPLSADCTWTFITGQAPDTNPPSVLSTTPSGGATEISVGTPITVTFSESVTNVTEATFKLATNGAPVPGEVTVKGWFAIFTPSVNLTTGTAYTATVTTGVNDLAGNAMAMNHSWTFTTAGGPDMIPPTIVATYPDNGATGASGFPIIVTFSEPVTNVTGTTFLLSKDGVPVPGTVTAPVAGWSTLNWSEAMFTPSAPLDYGTTYRASVTTGVTDFSGKPLAADYGWSFTTRYTDWQSSLVETGQGDAFSPQVAVGFVSLIVWVQSDGTADSIWANSHDAISTWNGVPRLIETGSGNASSPQVAMDRGGGAIAVWVQSDGSAESIWANRSAVLGTGWGTPNLLETSGEKSFSPRIATNDGDNNAVVVWVQSDGTADSIWANRFDPATGWSTATLVETRDGRASFPQIAMDSNGNAVAVWVQSDGTADSVWANRLEPATGWGMATLIETGNGRASSPQVAMDNNGNVVAVWVQSDGIADSVWANRFEPATGWGTAILLESGTRQASSPRVAMNGGDSAVAVWVQSDGTAENIWANRFEPATGWGTATLIETGSGDAFSPRVAISGWSQQAIVVWVQSDGVADSIWTNCYARGSGWGTAKVIEAGGGRASSPQVGFEGAVAVAVWEEWDGTRRNIWSSQAPIGFPGPTFP